MLIQMEFVKHSKDRALAVLTNFDDPLKAEYLNRFGSFYPVPAAHDIKEGTKFTAVVVFKRLLAYVLIDSIVILDQPKTNTAVQRAASENLPYRVY